MSLLNSISENIILPLSDFITGQSISKQLKFLQKSQFWTREQLNHYQNIKLQELINHAFKNVPFYTDLFNDLRIKPEDIQSKEDLKKLPIITKDDLKMASGKCLAKNIDSKNLIYRSSSGSTGEPFQYYSTKKAESMQKASAIRTWYWMGYRLGNKYVKVSMNPRSSLLKKLQDFSNNSLYLSSNQLNENEFNQLFNKIIKYDPKYIRSYPIPLHFLAKHIKGKYNSYNCKSLIAINTTGSTLHDDIRKEIEDVFKSKIFDSYSCEGGAIFAECPTHEYYHPAEEYAISEFIEDRFTLNDPEKPLRHITTDLHNYASPFIRYDTQDYIVLGDQTICGCGRHYNNIKRIKGRDSDILVTPSGKILIVENFVAYFEWIPEVDQIQVIQDIPNEIIINLLVNVNFSEKIYNSISKYWQNYIGNDVNVIVKIKTEIKLTPTGKRRTLIRNPKIKLNG